MKCCLIMGSGRSGTSMIGGILHDAGYYMGDNLYPPRHSNPKGFFENAEINGINETILKKYHCKVYPFRCLLRKVLKPKKSTIYFPGKGQEWLGSFPTRIDINDIDREIETRIKKTASRKPFAYKDPRFSYTLPVWEHFLKPDTAFICVFREPNITVESILKECKTRDYLADLIINRKGAYKVWLNIYSHILFKNTHLPGNFFFVHYNQIYDGTALPSLADFLKVNLNSDFVDKNLKRTISEKPIPVGVGKIYKKLCELANYKFL